jgi:hypothetical protein
LRAKLLAHETSPKEFTQTNSEQISVISVVQTRADVSFHYSKDKEKQVNIHDTIIFIFHNALDTETKGSLTSKMVPKFLN